MKIGVVITVYDEHALVLKSIREIKNRLVESYVCVVHSDNNLNTPQLEEIKDVCDSYNLLSNIALEDDFDIKTLASRCITRNFNHGFSVLYDLETSFDCFVAMTADTLITDASSFQRRYEDMKLLNWSAMVSQAVGQNFHAVGEHGEFIQEGRHQTNESKDFACCLFFLEGDFATRHRAFSNTIITNPYTSEQCLGDELQRCLQKDDKYFNPSNVGRLNSLWPDIAYSYEDGVVYHALSGKPGR